MIRVENLTMRFGSLTAVNALSFEVRKGEIYGIVGPDGAGKSTLLRMIAAILPPNEGKITIEGQSVYQDPQRTKETIAYMPQRFGLYEDLTVEENLLFFGRLFGLSKMEIHQRSKRLYEFSRLEPFKDRLAGRLSGGMKQKLGLACSLIHSPQLILLDEPTNGVDPVSRREFWKILYDLLSDGVTIVVTTAYLDEAERCNRVALMYKGIFLTEGTPYEIKEAVGKQMLEIETSDARKGEKAILTSGEFPDIIMTGTVLRAFVDKPVPAKKRLHQILADAGIKVLSSQIRKPALEDCFLEWIAKGSTKSA